ncbi:TBC1 domain family member 25 [Sarcoptes scabiei]|nr:TBC1 domain family member 25 [Sarcoptes scabiei]
MHHHIGVELIVPKNKTKIFRCFPGTSLEGSGNESIFLHRFFHSNHSIREQKFKKYTNITIFRFSHKGGFPSRIHLVYFSVSL